METKCQSGAQDKLIFEKRNNEVLKTQNKINEIVLEVNHNTSFLSAMLVAKTSKSRSSN